MSTDGDVRCRKPEKLRFGSATSFRDGLTLRDLTPAAVLLVAGLTGLFAASFAGAENEGQYLVIAAPGASLGKMITLIGSAGGGFVEAGRFQNIAIAASPNADFAQRARNVGAWLVLPSPGIAGCSGSRTKVSQR